MREAAHALKGSIGNFAAGYAFESARKLESMAKEGNLRSVRQTFARLQKELDLLTLALRSLQKAGSRRPKADTASASDRRANADRLRRRSGSPERQRGQK